METITGDTKTAVIRMAKETQTRVTGLEGNMTTVLETIKRIQELLEGKATQAKVNDAGQPDGDHDQEEQAWMDDAASRATRTKQVPTSPAITNIDAIEQTINMGNTVFRSYCWVAEQIEVALK